MYSSGLNNRGGQKGGLHPIAYIHGRHNHGGQNLGQTHAENANEIKHAARGAQTKLVSACSCI